MTYSLLKTACPVWFAPLPPFSDAGEDAPGGWARVEVRKRIPDGTRYVENLSGKPKRYEFDLEVLTGKVFGTEGPHLSIDTKLEITNKCFALIFGSVLYTPLVMVGNCVGTAWRVGLIAKNLLMKVPTLPDRGVIPFVGDLALGLLFEVPHEILQGVWGVARAPFYGFAMMGASTYGVFHPIEGRKWLDRVQSSWHDGRGYRSDCRHTANGREADVGVTILRMLKGEKMAFLAWCMLKRGNLYTDKVGDKFRFEVKIDANKVQPSTKREEKDMADGFGVGSLVNYTGRGYEPGEFMVRDEKGNVKTDAGNVIKYPGTECKATGVVYANTGAVSTSARVLGRAALAVPESAVNTLADAVRVIPTGVKGVVNTARFGIDRKHFASFGSAVVGVVANPLSLVGRVVAAPLALVDPNQARRLHAHIDGLQYGDSTPVSARSAATLTGMMGLITGASHVSFSRMLGTHSLGSTQEKVKTLSGQDAPRVERIAPEAA